MYYTIYKITNKINGKFYIGKHQTKNLNDGYMGSGKLLKRAIKKYGLENFTKEILFVFDNESDMNAKENELVMIDEDSYNLCEGGKGGFGYINKNSEKKKWSQKGRKKTDEILYEKYGIINPGQLEHVRKKNSENMKKLNSEGKIVRFNSSGTKHSLETRAKMSLIKKGKHGVGSKNSQYGKISITNGIFWTKIKNTTKIPEGFWRGRNYSIPFISNAFKDN